MTLQEFMDKLKAIELGGDPSQLSSRQIMQAIGSPYGENVLEQLDPSMFQTINPSLLKSMSIGSYSPLIQQRQQNLMGGLLSNLQGKTIKGAYGGFASTGATTTAEARVKDIYGKGMEDVYSQAVAGISQSGQAAADIFSGWQQTPQSFVG